MQELEVDVHFGNIMCSNGGDYVEITITDKASGVQFLELPLSFEQFGRLVKGNGTERLKATVRGADVLGKKHVSERRSVTIPLSAVRRDRREDYEEWLRTQYKEDGWHVSTYLGSQGSVQRGPWGSDAVTLNFSVYKWVDA